MVRTADDDHIKVLVRCRPLNESEKSNRTPSLVSCNQKKRTVKVSQNLGGKTIEKDFHFDAVFGQYSTQKEIFLDAVAPIVDEVLQGFNCTVFAYGQTGTGKTHTMEGDIESEELKGIIPRAVETIFSRLNDAQTQTDANGERTIYTDFSAKVSFLELYNEKMIDLLSEASDIDSVLGDSSDAANAKKLRIVDDRQAGTVSTMNLGEELVKNIDEVLSLMKRAMAKRRKAETLLNKESSRSHCIFTITLHIKETNEVGEEYLKVGKLNLVDLAGSESVARSGANRHQARKREAGNINKSLLTLGRVITALVEKTPHIPYRDSKLTRLLQESLGGKAKTTIITTISPSSVCYEETISTLDYASRAKSIKNRPEANQKMRKKELIKDYCVEIDKLRKELFAQRSKDGVYLREEEYKELTESNKNLSESLAECEEALEERSQALLEKQATLEATEKDLEKERDENERNREEISRMTAEIDQLNTKLEREAAIKIALRKTESALNRQVNELKSRVDEAEGDENILADKSDKLSEILEKNSQLGSTFASDCISISNSLKSSINNFEASYLQTIAESGSQVNEKFLSMTNFLETSLDKSKKSITDLEKQLGELLESIKSQSQYVTKDIEESTENSSSALKSFRDQIFECLNRLGERFDGLKSTLQSFKGLENELNEIMAKRSSSFQQETQNFSVAYKRGIAAIVESCVNAKKVSDENWDKSLDASAESQEMIASLVQSKTELIAEKLGVLLKDLVSDSQKLISEEHGKQETLVKEAKEQDGKINDEINEKLESLEDVGQLHTTESSMSFNYFSDKLAKKVKTTGGIRSKAIESIDSADQRIIVDKESLDSLYDDEIEKLSKEGSRLVQQINILETGAAKALENSSNGLSSLVESIQGDNEKTITDSIECQNHISSLFNDHGNTLQKEIQEWLPSVAAINSKSDKFEDSQLLYVRTGQSPQKKKYPYDQNVYSTPCDEDVLSKKLFSEGTDDVYDNTDEQEFTSMIPRPLEKKVSRTSLPDVSPLEIMELGSPEDKENRGDERNIFTQAKESLKKAQSKAHSLTSRTSLDSAFGGSFSQEEIEGMKVKELRDALTSLSLDTRGKKDELRERLLSHCVEE